jgi:hypothetical protein
MLNAVIPGKVTDPKDGGIVNLFVSEDPIDTQAYTCNVIRLAPSIEIFGDATTRFALVYGVGTIQEHFMDVSASPDNN